jgi:hypothetical protein
MLERRNSSMSVNRAIQSIAQMKLWDRLQRPTTVIPATCDDQFDFDPDWLEKLASLPTAEQNKLIFCLKISLSSARPAVWRRIETKSVSLDVVHQLIQMSMGWRDSHLHGFQVHGKWIPLQDEPFAIGEDEITLAHLATAKVKRFQYIYDFGSDWKHTITIESVRGAEPAERLPRCIDGAGICPHEDFDGMASWKIFLKWKRHMDNGGSMPSTSIHERFSAINGTEFDLKNTNASFDRVFGKRKRDRAG